MAQHTAQTKVTFKLITSIHKSLVERLKAISMKRDAFINLVLKTELDELTKELDGKQLSPKIKGLISSDFNGRDTTLVSMTLDSEVAARLNEIVEKSNIVRDAFMNRLMYLILCPEKLMQEWNLEKDISIGDVNQLNAGALPTNPLDFLTLTIKDPLFFLRLKMDGKLYSGINGLPYCLICYEEYITVDDL